MRNKCKIFKRGKKQSGITLVVLVVTIVILLILAGVSLNLVLDNNGIISKAKEAKISSELSSYKSQLEMFMAEKKIENPEFYESSLTAGKNNLYYNTKTSENEKTIKDIIGDISNEYLDRLEVVKGKLTINTQDKNIIKIAQAVGVEPNPYDIKDGVLQSSEGNLLLMDENGRLTIPDSVIEIGEGAFSGLEGLKTIIIPGTVKKIATSAFAFNTTLETVILEEGVEKIGSQAFNGCSSIKNVTLPQSLNTLDSLAFYQCRNLETITIPGNVRDIGSHAFCGCSLLDNVVLENGNNLISDECFSNCINLKNITIPSTVTSISRSAFNSCTKLNKIILSENKNYTFFNGMLKTLDGKQIIFITNELLSGTNTLEIPEGVENFGMNIGSYTNIKQIKIPFTLTSIVNADYFPKSINNVTVDSNNSKYISENGILYTKDDKSLIMCYSKERDINIQEGILKLGAYSFKQAENAEDIVLPESLTSINSLTFSETSNCKRIVIGKNVSEISPTFKFGNYSGTVEISSENPYYTIENNILYSKDKKKLVCALYKVEGKFTVPEGVETIRILCFRRSKLND